MGIEAGSPVVTANAPNRDVPIYNEDQQVVHRTINANMDCVLPGRPGTRGWFRRLQTTPASPSDHVDVPPGHYAFASTTDAVQAGDQPWLLPHGQSFGPARFVLANFGVDQGWRVDSHPRFVTDLTGDRLGDIIGFGNAGVYTALNDGVGGFGQVRFARPNFGVDQGWRVDSHPRFVADLTGDRRSDIVGFGRAGVSVAKNDGAGGFGAELRVIANFGTDQGWRVDSHPRFVADITGDRHADIVGFGDAGVWIGLNTGDDALIAFGPAQFVLTNFGVDQGWRVDRHPRFVTDLTGDRRGDIIGFGDAGVWVALNQGGGFGPARFVLPDFGVDQGWRVDRHPRFVTDVTGDGRGDIVGFGDAGVWVAHNNGNGTFRPARLQIPYFGYSTQFQDWRIDKNPRLLADLTGNGHADIIGFADDGVRVAILDTTGPQSPQYVLENLAYDEGAWRVEHHPRVVADLTGDRRGDIVGFGDAGIYASFNQGSGPVPKPVATT